MYEHNSSRHAGHATFGRLIDGWLRSRDAELDGAVDVLTRAGKAECDTVDTSYVVDESFT